MFGVVTKSLEFGGCGGVDNSEARAVQFNSAP